MVQEAGLYTLRKELGLSQEKLAEKLGVSRNTISRWERGDYKPSAENTVALNKLFEGLEGSAAKEKPAPERPKRWPIVVLCIGVACALVIGIISLIGIHSINEKLDPVDTAKPMEEMNREEVDMSSFLEPGTRQPLQP